MTYGRNRKGGTQNPVEQQAQTAPIEEPIRIDGFIQVVEMLEYADPIFRESLLRRIQIQDAAMALQLRKTLAMR